MPNGRLNEATKKLFNNSGLRARIDAVCRLCDTAESEAGSLNKSDLLALDRADRAAVKALDDLIVAYESTFRSAGKRLLENVE